jgi:hypothetical protein
MAARMFAESTCDRCGTAERRERNTLFTPAGWRIAKVGYDSTTGFTAEQTRLLCDSCTALVLDAITPVSARSV